MALMDVFKKFSKKTKIIIAAGALAVIAAAVICIVIAGSGYTATTMRLLKIEGTVNLENSRGGVKPVSDNLRFQSGDALSTGADGLASVGLDNTKIITLQNDSRAEFSKKRKQLELKLTKGAIFFNVTEKLRADEKFEIKTSTMTAGIRGTSGMVYYDAADGRESLLITDGSVEVSATNPETGETKTAMVEAGQEIKVYLFFDRVKDSVAFELNNVTEAQLPKFAAKRIAENEALNKRVCDANNWKKENVQKKAAEPESTTTAAPKNEPATATTEATTTTTEATTTTTTAETTESTTVTESTTAKPTSTPTPKPKATSTPKPTPTKKPTPEVTESSAESTPETATETTKPASSEPTPPSGYSKWKVWGESTGTPGVFICYQSGTYLGYDDSQWVRLRMERNNDPIHTLYTFTKVDGSHFYTYKDTFNTPSTTTTTTKPTTTTTTTKPESSGPTPPSGYSKWSVWGDSTNTPGYYICSSGGKYMGYDDGQWVNLTMKKTSTKINTIYTFTKEDGRTYYTHIVTSEVVTSTASKPTTTTTTTKEAVPELPSGYSKYSGAWGTTYNGHKVYICCKYDSDNVASDYHGYENGKWVELTMRFGGGWDLSIRFLDPNGDVYFYKE